MAEVPTMTVVPLNADWQRARALAVQLGGPGIDADDVAGRAVARAERRRTRSPLKDAVRDEISADLWALGTEEARWRIVDLWAEPVLVWCRFGRSRGVDPEDAAHEVLLRAATGLARLRDPYAVGGWMWRTTWNVLREQERGPWRRWVSDLAAWLGAADPAPDPVEQWVAAEELQTVQRALARLPAGQRELLWGAYVDHRTRAELSAELGVPLGTLNRRLTAARAAFRRAWRTLEEPR